MEKTCDNCKFSKRDFAEGYILKDWSGRAKGRPDKAAMSKYWTYIECTKNVKAKALIHVNLMNDCKAFSEK